MLKRLWVVISVLWSAFWVMIGLSGGGGGFFDNGAFICWILAPWIVGVVAWVSWRFITGPRISRSTDIDRY